MLNVTTPPKNSAEVEPPQTIPTAGVAENSHSSRLIQKRYSLTRFKSRKRLWLSSAIIILVSLIGLGVSVVASQLQQDTRSDASFDLPERPSRHRMLGRNERGETPEIPDRPDPSDAPATPVIPDRPDPEPTPTVPATPPTTIFNVMPKTRLAFVWNWPGTGDSREILPHGNWDMIGNMSGQTAIDNRHWGTDATTWPTVKQAIISDISDLLRRLGTDVYRAGESEETAIRRRSVINVLNLPGFLYAKDLRRLTLLTDRMFEVSREADVPIVIKQLGYVWWDWEGCPTCWENPNRRDKTGCWDRSTPERCQATKFNWNVDVEWWGWGEGYVWANECVPNDPNKSLNGKCPNWGDPSSNFTWRDWTSPFPVRLPHPRLDSTNFREHAKKATTNIARDIKRNYQTLLAEGKADLFAGFITDNEIAFGWSFSPNKQAGSEYGVRQYVATHCPEDVLRCLPPKPDHISRQDWIRQKSEEYYRPDGFEWELVRFAGDYAGFLARIAQEESGLPDEKIISQSSFTQRLVKQGGVAEFSNTDAALNNNSIPGYSIYGSEISSDKTLEILRFLYNQRGIRRYAWVEYFDYAFTPEDWRSNLERLMTASSVPFIDFVAVTNWEPVLKGVLGRLANDNENRRHAAVVPFVRDYIANWQAPQCGNGVVERGEQCEILSENLRNPSSSPLLLNGATCQSAMGQANVTGSLGCNTNCMYDVSQCVAN